MKLKAKQNKASEKKQVKLKNCIKRKTKNVKIYNKVKDLRKI